MTAHPQRAGNFSSHAAMVPHRGGEGRGGRGQFVRHECDEARILRQAKHVVHRERLAAYRVSWV